jgi:hypothetical protein
MVTYLLQPKVPAGIEISLENIRLKEYYFIIECFFKGLMDGEAYSSISDSDIEVFLLV